MVSLLDASAVISARRFLKSSISLSVSVSSGIPISSTRTRGRAHIQVGSAAVHDCRELLRILGFHRRNQAFDRGLQRLQRLVAVLIRALNLEVEFRALGGDPA